MTYLLVFLLRSASLQCFCDQPLKDPWPAQGVSAWNFDVAALKEQAAREGGDPAMPTISEGPPPAPAASAEGGPQSYPLKLPASGPADTGVPGNGQPALNSAYSWLCLYEGSYCRSPHGSMYCSYFP